MSLRTAISFLGRILAISTLLLSGTVLASWDTCTTFVNSEPSWIQGYGPICAGNGDGCTECANSRGQRCIDSNEGDTCVEYPTI